MVEKQVGFQLIHKLSAWARTFPKLCFGFCGGDDESHPQPRNGSEKLVSRHGVRRLQRQCVAKRKGPQTMIRQKSALLLLRVCAMVELSMLTLGVADLLSL